MYYNIITRLLIPAAAVIAEHKCRPSELPIYMTDNEQKEQKAKSKKKGAPVEQPAPKPNMVEEAVGTVRKQIGVVCDEVSKYKEVAYDTVGQGVGQVHWLVNYLGDENNTAPKPGAIGIGALTGFVLGLRGGLFRRVVFTSAGALTMAAVCYPKEAAEYTKLGLAETKRYVQIGYNFIYGGAEEEVDMAALLTLGVDPNLPTSQSVVAHLHKDATHEDCHCPIGTCLSSHDDDEGALADTDLTPQGDECCVCVCDDDS